MQVITRQTETADNRPAFNEYGYPPSSVVVLNNELALSVHGDTVKVPFYIVKDVSSSFMSSWRQNRQLIYYIADLMQKPD